MPPKKNGYKMPGQLPKGSVLQDVFKKQYKLGASIGKGGFGEIYSAQQVGVGKATDYPYVVKIEPHSNGPLFVEMHFYTRNAKKADIEAFMASKKMKELGMPAYVASGSHEHDGEKYRFLVMEKFATDISKLFLANHEKFPEASVYKLALQIIDVLEYIHSRGYIHADIKGANILISGKNPNQSYLVDFGLASKFTNDTVFKPNPKKMHDGTIEYLSRDAHQGVQTRRGDLEILAYNMIQWLGCKLPWQVKLTDPKVVQASKEKHMGDINLFMKSCFGANPPDAIVQLLKYIKALKFNEAPNYEKLKDILKSGLKGAGGTISSPLQLKSTTKRKSDASTPLKSKKAKKVESDCEEEPIKETVNARGTPRRNATKATSRRKAKKADSDDEESEEETVKKVTPRRKGKKVVESDEESEEESVKKETSRRKAKKSEEETVKKVTSRRKVKKAESEEETVKKVTPKRKVNKKAVETKEESEEDIKPLKKAATKTKGKKAESEDDDQSEDTKKATPIRKAKADSDAKVSPKNFKTTPRRMAKKSESESDDPMTNGTNSENDDEYKKPTRGKPKTSEDNCLTPKTATLKATPKSTRKLYNKENDDTPTRRNSDEGITELKGVPKKRTRRVNTVSTIDDNGVVHNSEMMRIKSLMALKNGKPKPKKVLAKLNKSLEDIIDDPDVVSGSDNEEYVTLTRRVGRTALAK